MVRFAVILSVLLSVGSFESTLASPACAYKNRGLADCVAKCKDGWSRFGKMLGSNPWDKVVTSDPQLQVEAYVALACGSPTPSTPAQVTPVPQGPINAAPLPTTSSTPIPTTTPSVSTSSSTTSSTTPSITPSSTASSSTPTSTSVSSSTPASSSTSSSTPFTANVIPTTVSTRPPATTSPTSTRVTSTPAPTTTTTRAPAPAPTTTTTRAPAPTNNPPSGGSGTSSGDIQAYLNAHNSVRRNHGAVDLKWSDNLAAAAQRWANNCKFEHSKGAVGPFGENLSAGTSMSIARAVQIWAEEVTEYNPASPKFSHFTQMVWKGTTEVGCAVQTCTGIFGSTPAQFYVCEYNPAGNVSGRFAENVQV